MAGSDSMCALWFHAGLTGGTPAPCPPIPACFLFSKPGDLSPAGVEVYARERAFYSNPSGKREEGIKFSHFFFFFNDMSARESFLGRISGVFRRHIVWIKIA